MRGDWDEEMEKKYKIIKLLTLDSRIVTEKKVKEDTPVEKELPSSNKKSSENTDFDFNDALPVKISFFYQKCNVHKKLWFKQ